MIELFQPPRPPEVRAEDVRLIDQMKKGDGPRYHETGRFKREPTAEETVMRLMAKRIAEYKRRQRKAAEFKRRQRMRAGK